MSRLRPEIDLENLEEGWSYSVPDVAKALGYSKTYFRRRIRDGTVSAFCPNGHEYRILGREVKRLKEYQDIWQSLPPKRSMIERGEVNIIEVTLEMARKIGLQRTDEEAA